MPVNLRVADGVAYVTLNRYEKRNALDETMLAQLEEAVGTAGRDQEVRVLVLRGSGGFFCAGADISEWTDPGPDQADRLSRLGTAALNQIAALNAPTVAVVERSALGGGLELALACDLRITSHDAVFGYPEARLGNLTSWGGIARVVDTVGLAHARRLFMTARPIDGREAERIGLVTQAVDQEDLERLVAQTVTDVAGCDPLALRVLKDALRGFERKQFLEPALAALFSQSVASRNRKHAFFDQNTTSTGRTT